MPGSSFTAQIEDFRTRTMVKLHDGAVGTLYALLSSLVNLSPVADPALWKGWAAHWNGAVPPGMEKVHPGMFKGNWLVGDGDLPETVDYSRRDVDGGDTLARGYGALLAIDFADNWREAQISISPSHLKKQFLHQKSHPFLAFLNLCRKLRLRALWPEYL